MYVLNMFYTFFFYIFILSYNNGVIDVLVLLCDTFSIKFEQKAVLSYGTREEPKSENIKIRPVSKPLFLAHIHEVATS